MAWYYVLTVAYSYSLHLLVWLSLNIFSFYIHCEALPIFIDNVTPWASQEYPLLTAVYSCNLQLLVQLSLNIFSIPIHSEVLPIFIFNAAYGASLQISLLCINLAKHSLVLCFDSGLHLLVQLSLSIFSSHIHSEVLHIFICNAAPWVSLETSLLCMSVVKHGLVLCFDSS